MNDCPSPAELRHYLTRDQTLAPGQIDRIEAHVETCEACQAALDRLTSEEVSLGTTLPHLGPLGYRVFELLGAGGCGEVWLAQDLNLPRYVAIKTLHPRLAADKQAKALDLLRRDAGLLTQVDHPNIVRVYAWLTTGVQHYLVMQYVPGGSLLDLLKRGGPLEWQRAARYVADIGEALVAVHARGIVHRDVKPANILLDPARDEAVLTDFGVGSRLSDPREVAGSTPYMAPEAFDGQVSPSLDVYSLAATLFQLVTGSPPFPGPKIVDFRSQVKRGLPDPDPRCRTLPAPLERVIRTGLTPDLDRRPSLGDFVASLRGSLNQLLADTLLLPPSGTPTTAPVELRLQVSRRIDGGRYEPVAATHAVPDRLTRDMKRVPAAPDQVHLHTGDRVRIDVVSSRAGYLTVFNVGPAGHLNLLYPADLASCPPAPIEAGRPLEVLDVALTPPAGRERLFAVWSRQPLSMGQVQGLANPEAAVSAPYRATRDMKRVQTVMDTLSTRDRHAVVVEVEHVR
jgi:serine/threonine protein kinase